MQWPLVLNGAGVGNAGALRSSTGTSNTWAPTIDLQSSSSVGAAPLTQMTITGLVQGPNPTPVAPASDRKSVV